MDDGVFNWEEFENSFLQNSRSLSLGVERGVSTQAVNIDPELFYDFFMNFNKNNDFFNEARSVGFQRKKIFELSEELSFFIRRRNAVKYRNRRPEIDFGKHHLYLQNIKIENIEELLLQRYRIARFTATRKIQSALFDTLSVAIDIENSNPSTKVSNSEVLGQRILENKDRIIEALDDGEDNNFKNRIVNILNKINQKGELDKILGHSLLSQLFENMIDELEVEKLVLSSINLLVDKFNGYLIDGKKLFVNGREVYVEIDGEHHTVNELSSGERHILTFLALVLFEGQDRNFLIIDEPEISLNIKWQRELMSIFSALLPTTQIIVASHSPALAKRNPNFLSELKVWRS
ncbi:MULTISPECIES: AAA family ATPase [Shewanella]|nr:MULTISPECIES: AAA family ATPase [Shewanella]PWH03605.1 ATP-binding protein [Shewanella xiamenensis]